MRKMPNQDRTLLGDDWAPAHRAEAFAGSTTRYVTDKPDVLARVNRCKQTHIGPTNVWSILNLLVCRTIGRLPRQLCTSLLTDSGHCLTVAQIEKPTNLAAGGSVSLNDGVY